MDCIFCKITSGEIPSYTLYEDDKVKVFLDVNPKVNGHALIVPKKHYTDLFDIPDDLFMHVIGIAKKMERTFKEKLSSEGLTLIQNNGLPEEVKHFHLHLVPAYKEKEELVNVEDVYNQIKN